MCGICGYLGQGSQEILEKMTKALEHRGPDDQGFYLEPGLGLGHRRLSIIDLETGHQPMANENQTIWLIFNGEIYNFQELKKRLSGHQFKTQSDTEVIIHLYEEKGEGFLGELNGMFALALWDKSKRKLILGRDRLGQKPLYYSLINQTLIFGSEIKALLKHPLIKRELDLEGLAKYLIYEYVPAPHCLFKGIKKLAAGEYLVYQNNKWEIKKYWEIGFHKYPADLTQEEALNQLGQELERAVRMRLVSDVPLGVFLSGGLDSTAITYYAQKNSSQKIKTFSIGFKEQSFDESRYARQAARFLGSEHYERILRPEDALELIPRIVDFLDEPLGDGSIIPTYLLSQFTREKVTVALTGDGGDELLMGYPTFQAHKLAKLYQLMPGKKLIQSLINLLPVSDNNFSFDFKLKKFVAGYQYGPEIRNQLWLGSFSPEELKNLLVLDTEPVDYFEEIKKYLAGLDNESLENRLIYLYLKGYLQDDILTKTDRASMANGLEARAPFLDYRLVEHINSLPSDLKLRGWTTKYIFKELMKNKLPRSIVYRPKKGFGLPLAKWIKNELKDFVLDLFEFDKIKEQSIFNYQYINQLLQDHFSNRQDNRKQLWTLMVFQMWYNKWILS